MRFNLGDATVPDRYLLDFEEPLRQIRQKISEMEQWAERDPDHARIEIARLEEQEARISAEVYGKLSSWQRVQIARHPNRPYTMDYITMMTTDFTELHGDRYTGDDSAMIAGFAKFDGVPMAVIGQQKGRDNEERIHRNFGMPNPEGYRKALRIMKMAEKFNRPVVTFVDTPGAFPGVTAEKHGQGEALARNLLEMSRLKTPIIVTIIGEGGSGGALGIAIGDRIIMLENAWYSVIAPESCSTILMRSPDKKEKLSEELKLTAHELKKLGIIDHILKEPLGGAQNDPKVVAAGLKSEILNTFFELKNLSPAELVQKRFEKFRNMGTWVEKR